MSDEQMKIDEAKSVLYDFAAAIKPFHQNPVWGTTESKVPQAIAVILQVIEGHSAFYRRLYNINRIVHDEMKRAGLDPDGSQAEWVEKNV